MSEREHWEKWTEGVSGGAAQGPQDPHPRYGKLVAASFGFHGPLYELRGKYTLVRKTGGTVHGNTKDEILDKVDPGWDSREAIP